MEEHPCGNLPVHGVTLSLWYCPHHNSVWWLGYTYDEMGGMNPEIGETRSGESGPLTISSSDFRRVWTELLDAWLERTGGFPLV
jgi:hypothetical protein